MLEVLKGNITFHFAVTCRNLFYAFGIFEGKTLLARVFNYSEMVILHTPTFNAITKFRLKAQRSFFIISVMKIQRKTFTMVNHETPL